MVVLFSVFWGISMLFSMVVVLIYVPTNNAWGSPFSLSSAVFTIACLFDKSHFNWSEIITHCNFAGFFCLFVCLFVCLFGWGWVWTCHLWHMGMAPYSFEPEAPPSSLQLWFAFLWLMILSIFYMPIGHLYAFFWKTSIQFLCPFKKKSDYLIFFLSSC